MKYKDLIKNTNFCILPWVSVETTPMGTLRPCCLAIDEIEDNGEKYNLKEHTLSQAMNSNYMQNMRKSFLEDRRLPTCNRCWTEEDSGRTSKRINTLVKFKHEVEEMSFDSVESDQLWFLDLKLGNICNLKCRICGSWSSSNWASEEIKYDVSKGANKEDTFAYKMLKAGNWPRESADFWKDLTAMLPTVRYFEFTGGEPFLIKEHFDLLKLAVDTGVSKNITIHYNTNSTQMPEHALKDLWPHFKEVEVAFSVDNIGAKFEYERHGANWEESNQTIDQFNLHKQHNSNLSSQLCFTINMFNCLDISELLEWAEKKQFDAVHWNMLHDPNHFNVSYVPQPLKDIFVESLQRKQTFDKKYIDEVNSLVRFIQQDNQLVSADKILNMINRADKYRGESFAELYPELHKCLTALT